MVRMTMTMAAVCKTTLLLLCCSVVFCKDSQDSCNSYITTGANVTLPLHHHLKNDEKLRWKHNSQVLLSLKTNQIILGSEMAVFVNGSLKLTNVKKNHSGKYSPEVFGNDGKRVDNLNGIFLCVLDPVPKPTITLKCEKNRVIFTCAGQGTKDFTIKWLQDNKELKAEQKETLTRDIKQVKGSITCQIANMASSMTSNPVTGPCQKPSGGFPERIMGISVWIFVGGGGAIVLVLIIITIVCCVRAKRKKRMQLKDEEELRLGWTNPQQQQQQHECRQYSHPPSHHHHGHHQQQQPAGHTGPRQHRPKQQRPRAPDPINGQPQPSPRRPAQTPRPVVNDDDEQPPPLPQPRKKAPKTPRM